MNRTYLRVCAWAGPFCAFLWIIGLLFFADFLPPPKPRDDANEVAAMMADNTTGIRWGTLFALAAIFWRTAAYSPLEDPVFTQRMNDQIVCLPGTVIPLFKSGPLAWNGIFAFWIPAAVYTVWMCLLTWVLLRAIDRPDPRPVGDRTDDPQPATGVVV